jgi:hypothetical protein
LNATGLPQRSPLWPQNSAAQKHVVSDMRAILSHSEVTCPERQLSHRMVSVEDACMHYVKTSLDPSHWMEQANSTDLLQNSDNENPASLK